MLPSSADAPYQQEAPRRLRRQRRPRTLQQWQQPRKSEPEQVLRAAPRPLRPAAANTTWRTTCINAVRVFDPHF